MSSAVDVLQSVVDARLVDAVCRCQEATLTAMKGVASLSTRPSSCTVLKPPPPYSSYMAPPAAAGYGVETVAASLGGYARTCSDGLTDDDDGKVRRRSRGGVAGGARSPGGAPPTAAAKTRRHKRPSSGLEQARRHHQQHQLQQSYRQLTAADRGHGWPAVDSAYSPVGTDYAAAAAACHSGAASTSCRYQARPPYRHDLLAVVPAIGPGETGPAAERLKQMAAHYQRLAASGDGAQSSFGCYDERYASYGGELGYDEFTASQFQHYQQQQLSPHLYYDYAPMIAATDAHGAYLNGVSQPPTNAARAQFADPEAISAPHVTAQFGYGAGGLAGSAGYGVDGVSRYMSPCAQQTATTTTTTTPGLQAPAPMYSGDIASEPSACQPATVASTAIQSTVCFAAESRPPPVDSFLEIYQPSATSATMSTSASSCSTSSLSSRRSSSNSSTIQPTSTAAPVSARSSWTLAADSGEVGSSSTAWLTGQLDGVTTSADAAASFSDTAAAQSRSSTLNYSAGNRLSAELSFIDN